MTRICFGVILSGAKDLRILLKNRSALIGSAKSSKPLKRAKSFVHRLFTAKLALTS